MSRAKVFALAVLAVLIAGTAGVPAANAQGSWTTYAGRFGDVLLQSVSMVGVGNGWAVGNRGTILGCSGGLWTGELLSFHLDADLWSVHMLTASDGWAVGAGATILHYDGSSWSLVTTSIPSSIDLYSVRMVSSNEVWAVGKSGTIFHYDGLHRTWSSWACLGVVQRMISVRSLWRAVALRAGLWGAMERYFVLMVLNGPLTHKPTLQIVLSSRSSW